MSGERRGHQRFASLDGMRGIAASAVVVGHTASELGFRAPNANYWLAVPFFFTLSGFVLEYVYASKLRAGFSQLSYFVQRLIRLYPLAGVSSLLVAGYVAAASSAGTLSPRLAIWGLLSALTTLPSPATDLDGWRWPFNHPEWSLFWEVVASLGFGLLLYQIGSRLLLGIMCACIAGLVYMTNHSAVLIGGLSGQALTAAYSFSAGVMAFRMQRRIGWLPASAGRLAYIAMLACLVCPWRFNAVGDLLFLVLAAPAAILAISLMQTSGWQARIQEFAGEISYPLYIVHWPLLLLVSLTSLPVLTKISVTLALALTVSFAASRLIDIPVRARLRKSRIFVRHFHMPFKNEYAS